MKAKVWFALLAVASCSAENTVAETTPKSPEAITGGEDEIGGSAGSQVYYSTTGGAGTSVNAGGSSSSDSTVVQDSGAKQIVDGNVCGSKVVPADVEIITQSGNLLVIFDRSGSMSDTWNDLPKYQAAGEAMIAAITPLQETLTIGGIFFPSLPTTISSDCNIIDFTHWLPGGPCLELAMGSCEVSDISSTDQISFRSGPEFAAEAPNQWLLIGATGTPLGNAVIRADEALASITLQGTVAVLIMTDGEPNCGTDMASVISTVSKWTTSGISSYVVGLPGSEAASDFLTDLAVAGGTADFIVPDDPAALLAEISKIVTQTVKTGLKSCTITLEQDEGADLENLHLIVMENGQEKEVLQKFGGGGWSVTPDGTVATLEGRLCEDAKNGRFESVRFDFGCVEVPILIE
ncbi:MAG: VWA domain-containing protein [Deltaproteobacteria bacterium]|nr:VWA domain-containing protein [Deltaproteobacteria bacterium]